MPDARRLCEGADDRDAHGRRGRSRFRASRNALHRAVPSATHILLRTGAQVNRFFHSVSRDNSPILQAGDDAGCAGGAARLFASALGIEVHGSLGILLWVAAAGHLDRREAEAALSRLAASSLRISRRVLEEARFALHQVFG